MFKEITVHDLEKLLQEGAVLVDVRTHGEVAQGMIPDAKHVPLDEILAHADSFSKDQPLVLQCKSGGRSAQACALLEAKGFKNLYNLAGGIEAWRKAGKPTT